jgi:hypothetical protein
MHTARVTVADDDEEDLSSDEEQPGLTQAARPGMAGHENGAHTVGRLGSMPALKRDGHQQTSGERRSLHDKRWSMHALQATIHYTDRASDDMAATSPVALGRGSLATRSSINFGRQLSDEAASAPAAAAASAAAQYERLKCPSMTSLSSLSKARSYSTEDVSQPYPPVRRSFEGAHHSRKDSSGSTGMTDSSPSSTRPSLHHLSPSAAAAAAAAAATALSPSPGSSTLPLSPSSRRRLSSQVSLLELSKSTESITDLLAKQPTGDEQLAVGVQKHRQRRSLKALDNCVVYSDLGRSSSLNNVSGSNLHDDRVTPYEPLPDLATRGRRRTNSNPQM